MQNLSIVFTIAQNMNGKLKERKINEYKNNKLYK